MKFVTGPFPNDGLRYPKTTEKPSFQTREEIQRRIAAGGMSAAEQVQMWEAVYLKTDEIEQLLGHVKANATQPFIYPIICFAAHTGARRSEIIRTRLADVDFTGKTVIIREKKRVRAKSTTRRVPLSTFLVGVLQDWLNVHPGGAYLFCLSGTVARSKKRSPTTGHQGQQKRPTTTVGRASTVQVRASRSRLMKPTIICSGHLPTVNGRKLGAGTAYATASSPPVRVAVSISGSCRLGRGICRRR